MFKKKLVVLASLMLVFLAGRALAVESSTQNVTITVAPVVDAVFTIDPNVIELGNVELGQSTGNVTALEIENLGNSSLQFDKTVWTDAAGWELTADQGHNEYVLSAAAQASAPGDWSAAGLMFDTTPQDYNPLTNDEDAQLNLDPEGVGDHTANLWFMLDMPTSVGGAGTESQTITVRIRGSSSE